MANSTDQGSQDETYVTINKDPVGHDGTRVDIAEKKLPALSGGMAVIATLLLLAVIALCAVLCVWSIPLDDDAPPPLFFVSGIVGVLLLVVLLTSVKVVSPGHTLVAQFFGNYIGTLRSSGYSLIFPFTVASKVSIRVHNFETNETKVNDYNGNPIHIAAIIVWQVADTAKASFSVEEYKDFLQQQSESALRHIATQHPYDSPVDGRSSLRGATDEVSGELADEVANRAAVAGIEIIEARISSLSYAPEIAQSMLQRQQAAAVVDAREQIVEGAVSMVETALSRLEEREIVELDPERRAAMVSNLLVVLCSESNTQPMINTGTLYH